MPAGNATPIERVALPCRACDGSLEVVIDLGLVPPADRFPAIGEPVEVGLPLRLGLCRACGLAQLADDTPGEVDGPDAVPPTSSSTIAGHVGRMVARLVADGIVRRGSRVLEAASHGARLRPFFQAVGVETTILEVDADRAAGLRRDGIPVIVRSSAGRMNGLPAGRQATGHGFDLVVDFYALAHLGQPRAAIAELASHVADGGWLIIEVDHLLATVNGRQFDAIGHGHFVYLTLTWLMGALQAEGLMVSSASLEPVFGGALRVVAQRRDASVVSAVSTILDLEAAAGLDQAATFERLAVDIAGIRADVRRLLETAREAGATVVGYGAPARAVTFLNALDIDPDLLAFTVDRSPTKQGRAIPGTGIPILPPAALASRPGADVLVLAWDLAHEIRASLPGVEQSGGRFLVAIPSLAVVGDLGPVSPP